MKLHSNSPIKTIDKQNKRIAIRKRSERTYDRIERKRASICSQSSQMSGNQEESKI
jgi:hypothetical protein